MNLNDNNKHACDIIIQPRVYIYNHGRFKNHERLVFGNLKLLLVSYSGKPVWWTDHRDMTKSDVEFGVNNLTHRIQYFCVPDLRKLAITFPNAFLIARNLP